MTRIAFLASGNGTNMENLVKEIQAGRIPGAEASVLICDKPVAGAIGRADALGMAIQVVDRKDYATKQEFERAIEEHLDDYNIELIVLAGFMRILSPEFVRLYEGRIINIHPALLPAFPGAHAIRDAFEAKVKETGVTVHFVDEGVDTGPIILQRKVPVQPDDTLESLEARIHKIEYELYPEALRKVLKGSVRTSGQG